MEFTTHTHTHYKLQHIPCKRNITQHKCLGATQPNQAAPMRQIVFSRSDAIRNANPRRARHTKNQHLLILYPPNHTKTPITITAVFPTQILELRSSTSQLNPHNLLPLLTPRPQLPNPPRQPPAPNITRKQVALQKTTVSPLLTRRAPQLPEALFLQIEHHHNVPRRVDPMHIALRHQRSQTPEKLLGGWGQVPALDPPPHVVHSQSQHVKIRVERVDHFVLHGGWDISQARVPPVVYVVLVRGDREVLFRGGIRDNNRETGFEVALEYQPVAARPDHVPELVVELRDLDLASVHVSENRARAGGFVFYVLDEEAAGRRVEVLVYEVGGVDRAVPLGTNETGHVVDVLGRKVKEDFEHNVVWEG
ncbi:translocon at the inner envelope membrane ofchloroplasts 55-II [Striga asiatica]|uniref:Translocon at the inner envelope membrane ofchloroplasts 55-II n=1 Tax=Striga asiatica TaxID=4170 RepID=A0A5A7QBU4_STRAF|nr:translocon at the inner envelope membrane ofchloroplasts 55-II [Striga asiatica]